MRTTLTRHRTDSGQRINLIGALILLATVLVALPPQAEAAPFTLSGNITNEMAEPLPGIVVRSYTSIDLETLEAETTTDAAGDYTFAGLDNSSSRYLQLTDLAGDYAYQGNWVYASGDPTIRDFIMAIGGSISGRVISDTGEPVGGVTVASTRGPVSTTAADGSYTLAGLPAGTQYVYAFDLQGWYLQGAGPTITLDSGEQIADMDIVVVLGVKVSGTVTDVSGLPVSSAIVSGVSWVGYSVTGTGAFLFVTDADGKYSGTITPGAFGIVGKRYGDPVTQGVYGGGTVPSDGDWSTRSLFAAVAGEELPSLDIVLDGNPYGRVTGMVTDETSDTGVDGLAVTLTRYPTPIDGSSPDTWQWSRGTSGGGLFDWYLPPGSYRVTYGQPTYSNLPPTHAAVWLPGVATSSEATTVNVVAGQTSDLSLSIATGSRLSGSVTNSSGADAFPTVRVFDQDGTELVGTVTTGGAPSIYELRLLPGVYDITFEAFGLGTYRADNVVVDSSDVVLDVVMPEMGVISGTITYPGGAPAASVGVQVVGIDGSEVEQGGTDSDGTYSIDVPTGDTYLVSANRWIGNTNVPGEFWGPVYYGGVGVASDATGVSVAPGSLLENIDIELQPAPFVNIAVTGSDGTAIPARVSLLDPVTGNPGFKFGSGFFKFDSTSAPDGLLAFSVEAGSFVVHAHTYDADPSPDTWMPEWYENVYRFQDSTPTIFGLGTVTNLDIVLEAASLISGSVTDGASTPVNGALVIARGPGDVFLGATITGPSGDYSWPILTPGDYTLEFRRDGFPTEWWDDAESLAGSTSITVGTAETIMGVDMVLGPYIPPPPPPPPPPPDFVDDDGSIFEPDIEWMAAAGITKGCNPPTNDKFCPDGLVTRGQMAAFLVRALKLTDDGGGNTFSDDDGSIFEADIAKMAAAGITKGCNPPTNDKFCPDGLVTRGQMAAFLHRALG